MSGLLRLVRDDGISGPKHGHPPVVSSASTVGFPLLSTTSITSQSIFHLPDPAEKGVLLGNDTAEVEALWHLSANKADDLRFVICWQLLHHSKKAECAGLGFLSVESNS